MSREAPLAELLYTLPPRAEDVLGDEILDRFLRYVAARNLELYPAQEEAILELTAGNNVLLTTPTGSGKSLVATAVCFAALARRQRVFFTCPVKALVSEKFFALCKDFGPEYVGMMTGDATVNRDAPIVCGTAEVLSNIALRQGDGTGIDWVVMDEFHYYADRERGVAWQVPLLTMRGTRFLLMSATFGLTEPFERAVEAISGAAVTVVGSKERPVPLDFTYKEIALHETLLELSKTGKVPAYVVCFTQKGAAEQAQNLMSVDYCTKAEKRQIIEHIGGFRFDTPYGKDIKRHILHGIGIHHAGLLPKYRLLVEKIAQTGLLKIICGTDTLGVGVNIPIRTVVLTKLCKFDGEKTGILSVREFQQISGRAGRRGFDEAGSVVVQAPEHVIENMRMEQKAQGDKAKMRKLVRRKPPERGYVHWDRQTFDRLVSGTPEPLVSRFRMTHGMMLGMLQREDGGAMPIARLIKASHEKDSAKRHIGRQAITMFQSLVSAGIIHLAEATSWRGNPIRRAEVSENLQEDFSLHQALGLYLLDTIPKLTTESETYALDLLTLVESILENPEAILFKQLDRVKRDKVAELKAAGVEYEQRMEELEKLTYPKPQSEFIYGTFNEFSARHPWVGENIRPKSIAREMVETFQSFHDYIKDYELQRSEGLLLRYLSDVYKTLSQTVPPAAKDETVMEIESFLFAIVSSVDNSLLEEWERLKSPIDAAGIEGPAQAPRNLIADPRAFSVLVRNTMFSIVRALARKDYAAIFDDFATGEGDYRLPEVELAMREYATHCGPIRTDTEARSPACTRFLSKEPDAWIVEQSLLDEEGPSGWVVTCRFDLEAARDERRPIASLMRIGSS